MLSSTIKGPGFFLFFRTYAQHGKSREAKAESIKRDLVTLQITRIFKEQDLISEHLALADFVEPEIDSELHKIEPLEFKLEIEHKIEVIEAELVEIVTEIKRKNHALALILIMLLL